MLHTRPVAFTLYDGRRHVLAASMLAAVDAAAREAMKPALNESIVIRRAKFIEKVGFDGHVAIADRDDDIAPIGLIAAEISGSVARRQFRAWIVGEPSLPAHLKARSGHRLSDLRATDRFSGSSHVRASGRETVLFSLIDACKHVQLADPALKGRSIVVELLFVESLSIDAAIDQLDGQVSIRNIGSRDAFGRIVTLSELTFLGGGGATKTMRLSMSFHTAVAA